MMSDSWTTSDSSGKKKVRLTERVKLFFVGKKSSVFFGKLVLIFATSFFIFFWLTHNTFTENKLLQQTSRVTLNFVKLWEDKFPDYVKEILYSEIKPTQQEELLNYKLTMVSKSLNQYFKNLLVKTQEQVASISLLSFIQDDKNYYNYYKTKRDLQKHLENNRDILEFSLYKFDGTRIVTLKHKKVPDYFISTELLSRVGEKNNLLLKHKNSANLVLLSSVTHQGNQVMVISQTINPVFFTRILNYLEASKELFYLKDSDDFIIVDNYDAKTFNGKKALDSAHSNDHRFISLYETFVNLHEKNIKIDFDKVEYSLGMVVERNNVWGNIFSVLTLVFIIFISKIAVDSIFKLAVSVANFLRQIFLLGKLKTGISGTGVNGLGAAAVMPNVGNRSTDYGEDKNDSRFSPPANKTANSSSHDTNTTHKATHKIDLSEFHRARSITGNQSNRMNADLKKSASSTSPITQKVMIEESSLPPFSPKPKSPENRNKPILF